MDYSCYCYISTDPGPALTLVKKHTHHGYWQKHPPKSVPAGTTWAGFRNKDYPGPLGSQGEVVYKTDDGGVHYNRYFAHNFDEALGLAVRLRIGFEEGVEEVVAIRPATRSEAAGGRKASAHFLELMPLAISSVDKKGGKE